MLAPAFLCPLVFALALSFSLHADEPPDLDPLCFAEDILAFQEWEAKNTLPEGRISFVGSSNIRM